MNTNEYREKPRTGTTNNDGMTNASPTVDPSLLTDDRGNGELFVFEKTWGHRLLAGTGAAMVVISAILVIYCALRLANIAGTVGVSSNILAIGYLIYGIGLGAGILAVPPALVAMYAAKHPKYATLAVVLAVIALLLVAAYVVYALAAGIANVVGVFAYAVLFAIVPVVYLVAALKVKRS